jgi:hypothetical protein
MIKNEGHDGSGQYSMIFADDYLYNVHWNSRLDWSHLAVIPSMKAEDSDKTIIFRYNYTEYREIFDVFERKLGKLTDLYG